MQTVYPGLALENISVYFLHSLDATREPKAVRWDLNQSESLLGAILSQRRWDDKINVVVMSDGTKIQNLQVRYAIGNFKYFFFLSHNWNDNSVQNVRGNKTVMRELVSMVEDLSRESVWADEFELDGKTKFHKLMSDGVTNAKCCLICLSVKYLNSHNCLLELKWAVERHAEEGVPIIVISVDPLLSPKNGCNRRWCSAAGQEDCGLQEEMVAGNLHRVDRGG